MNLYKNIFNYEMPDEMLEYLHSLKTISNYNQATSLIEESFADFKDMVEAMWEGNEKNKRTKMLSIVDKILKFALEEQNQRAQGRKILIPNQMLSRLPIPLAHLKAGNNSEKLKNEIR